VPNSRLIVGNRSQKSRRHRIPPTMSLRSSLLHIMCMTVSLLSFLAPFCPGSAQRFHPASGSGDAPRSTHSSSSNQRTRGQLLRSVGSISLGPSWTMFAVHCVSLFMYICYCAYCPQVCNSYYFRAPRSIIIAPTLSETLSRSLRL
jgi:hypothetical protein